MPTEAEIADARQKLARILNQQQGMEKYWGNKYGPTPGMPGTGWQPRQQGPNPMERFARGFNGQTPAMPPAPSQPPAQGPGIDQMLKGILGGAGGAANELLGVKPAEGAPMAGAPPRIMPQGEPAPAPAPVQPAAGKPQDFGTLLMQLLGSIGRPQPQQAPPGAVAPILGIRG